MNVLLKQRARDILGHRLGSEFSVSYLDRNDIFALGESWEKLSTNVIEENPYYSPTFMRALLEHVESTCDIKALAVYKDTLLVGFLPFVIDKWRWMKAAPLNCAWINPYITLTTPLVDRDYPREVVEALVAGMNEHGAAGSFWLFDNFNLDGPVGKLFNEILKAGNLPSKIFNEFNRPILDQGATFDEHMRAHVSKSRIKGLKRSRKRLCEQGTVSLRSYNRGPELETAVEEFLTIEASGWKGEQGTALACEESTKAFARQAFGSSDGKSITRADVLYLDEKAIAVSLAIYVGKTAFTLKCAYDEEYRSYGPGLLLEQDIIEDFFETRWADRLDSAITVSGHVLQGLWSDSMRVGDLLLCADGAKTPENFKHYAQIEKLRRLFRQKLKDIIAKTRGN